MASNSTQKKKSGSTEHAASQANMVPPEQRGAVQRHEAGEYTLLTDRYSSGGEAGHEFDHLKGDTVHIDSESKATRLVAAGAIAPTDSRAAKRAQAKGDPVQEKQVRAEELEREAARLRSESQNPSQRAEADEEE